MEQLEHEIKQLIIDTLRLERVTPEAIDPTAPLFVEGLGLDSIDALELAMEIRKRYGVRTAANDERNRAIFSSVRSLASFISDHRQPAQG
ncbi:MAG TPA: phosphopantetheine-binding protein [Anaeromyxobacteraceae bacterium]|nr:phosphopantetheine-binding protein [Anaeromyxobacteraceae bacterium]